MDATLTLKLSRQERSVPLYIGAGLASTLGSRLSEFLTSRARVLVVTDETVASLYAPVVLQSLEAAGFQVTQYTFTPGEENKTLATAEQVWASALKAGLSRQDAILALGGGVVGDLAGFCASTYLRGIHLIQVPTTLLAQVDSAVGGKVGVNFQDIKNGVGAFYQPLCVISDLDTLKTLPPREFKAGLSEVLKYGLIAETATGEASDFLTFLEQQGSLGPFHMADLVARCCAIKSTVVARDETEADCDQAEGRACLNLGHTFAHAYEVVTGYKRFLHGEAVALGLGLACRLSVQMKLLPASELDRYLILADALGLSMALPTDLDPQALVALMGKDKKASGGMRRFVLPTERLGRVAVHNDVSDAQLLKLWD